MAKYLVTVTQYHLYEVEAENATKARNLGLVEFDEDMRDPIADTHYDEVEVDVLDEE